VVLHDLAFILDQDLVETEHIGSIRRDLVRSSIEQDDNIFGHRVPHPSRCPRFKRGDLSPSSALGSRPVNGLELDSSVSWQSRPIRRRRK
jgi:hypothetical protein